MSKKKQSPHRWSFTAYVAKDELAETKSYPVPGVFLGYEEDVSAVVDSLTSLLIEQNPTASNMVVKSTMHEVVSEEIAAQFLDFDVQMSLMSRAALFLASQLGKAIGVTLAPEKILSDILVKISAWDEVQANKAEKSNSVPEGTEQELTEAS